MAERSMPWDSTGVGDGPLVGYTELQTLELFRDLIVGDRFATDGPLPGVLGELAVTGSGSPLSMASGSAMVYGFYYQNTAALSLAISSPVVGTTGFRVVLRADWSLQTVRATVVKNTDGTSAIPALVQTALTTYDIPVATGTITTGGSISLTDAREFVHNPSALIYRRQGGSATDWSVSGTTSYTPGETMRQLGAVSVSYSSGTGTAVVTFPVAFSQVPHIQLTVYNAASSTRRKILATVEAVTTTTVTIRTYLTDESTGSSSVDVYWEAVGVM